MGISNKLPIVLFVGKRLLQRSVWNCLRPQTSCLAGSIVDQKRTSILQRSFMYVPGDKMSKIEKMANANGDSAPDIVVLDCEDGVGYAKKAEARENIGHALSESMFSASRSQIAVRINSIESGLADDDLRAMLTAKNYPQMINVPKVDDVEHFNWLANRIKQYSCGQKGDNILWVTVMIESARAITRLETLCEHAVRQGWPFRMQGVVFGSDDYCASIGVQRSDDNSEILYARQKIVTTAKAFNISAIDMVDIDIKDLERLQRNSQFSAQLGFSGKQVVHPSQLEPVHRAYSPSLKRAEWAQSLLAEFEQHTLQGQGVFVFRGQMIDMPTILQARSINAVLRLIEERRQ